jgi:hypothetical protein
MNEHIFTRANNILNIAKHMAENHTKETGNHIIENHIEQILLHTHGYAEKGYSSRTGIVATGNWNIVDRWDDKKKEHILISNLPERISRLFESLGIECEWSDGWTVCDECARLVRTQSDSHWWKPYYVYQVGNTYCLDCAANFMNEV